jgi:hypothetical protein
MKYRFRSNEKAIITANLSEEEKGKEIKRGMIPGVYVPDYLARRLPVDDEIYIKLFDLSQLANGTDSLFYEARAEEDWFLVATDPPGLTRQPVSSLETTEFNDYIFTNDYEDFPTLFREITATYSDYDIALATLGAYVPGQGLPVPEGVTTVNITGSSPYFPAINIGATTSRKYTALPSYASPSVTFTLDKSCDIFLSPAIYLPGDGTLSMGSGYGRTFGVSGYPYLPATEYVPELYLRALSRQDTLSSADWANIWTNRAIVDQVNITQSERDYFRGLLMDDIQMYEVELVTNNDYVETSGGSVTAVAGSGYPSRTSGSWRIDPFLNLYNRGYNAGTLLAAIRKRIAESTFEWYFMWNTADISPVTSKSILFLEV